MSISVQVYKGRRKFTGNVVALKYILKLGKSAKELEALRQEIEILKTLRHENIIRMLDSFETKTDIVVVTEFAQGRQAEASYLFFCLGTISAVNSWHKESLPEIILSFITQAYLYCR